jgi:hypothetical protein
MGNVVNLRPALTKWGPDARTEWGRVERARLVKLFAGKSVEDMRHLWDTIGDNSFSGPYDCQDIHSYMNMLGDGGYCAV